jgi:hypothetical protein
VIVTLAAGLVLALVVAGPPYALWARRRLRRAPGVFACRLRPAGPLDGAHRWPRTKRQAQWVHDVLIVRHGLTLGRCEALGVANATGPVDGTGVRGLGVRPLQLRLHLDDGRVFDVVVRRADAASAIGPFVVASLESA